MEQEYKSIMKLSLYTNLGPDYCHVSCLERLYYYNHFFVHVIEETRNKLKLDDLNFQEYFSRLEAEITYMPLLNISFKYLCQPLMYLP